MTIPSNQPAPNPAKRSLRPEGLSVIRLRDLELGGLIGSGRPDRFFHHLGHLFVIRRSMAG